MFNKLRCGEKNGQGEGETEREVEVQWELNTHYLVVVCRFSATLTLTIHIIMIFICEEKYSILLHLYDTVIHKSISYLTIKFMYTYVVYVNILFPQVCPPFDKLTWNICCLICGAIYTFADSTLLTVTTITEPYNINFHAVIHSHYNGLSLCMENTHISKQ
jgi:hypothetical protein